MSYYVGDRSKREPVALTASVEWHLGASSESVNRKKQTSSFFLLSPPRRPFTAYASDAIFTKAPCSEIIAEEFRSIAFTGKFKHDS